MTNMDALSIPAGGGVDTTALIVGDFSNGNDAIILKDKTALADIKGQKVNLVELSVSHYLLARALDTVGLAEKDITVVNTSDADMVAAYGTQRRDRGGHLEPAGLRDPRHARRRQGVRFLADSRRDHRPHGGQHRDAEGQSRFRQGAGRRLVRGRWR